MHFFVFNFSIIIAKGLFRIILNDTSLFLGELAESLIAETTAVEGSHRAARGVRPPQHEISPFFIQKSKSTLGGNSCKKLSFDCADQPRSGRTPANLGSTNCWKKAL